MDRSLRRATGVGAAAALAVAGAVVLGPGGAGAQSEPTFSVTPSSLAVGETATLTATGCVSTG
jgi:hypothetical protein